MFTVATCHPRDPLPKGFELKGPLITESFSCALEAEKRRCLDGGGTCDISRDGYYITNIVCVVFGVITFALYIRPAAMKLQALPLRAWRLGWGERGG
jgi:PAT family acetyl-CoA transporter-like MFS transporter 1